MLSSLKSLTNEEGSFNSLTHYPELVLDKWARAFGKIYSVWLGNQLFVIVSEASIAKDLLVTNGNVFSSRKEMFVKNQTILAGRGITSTPYNITWQAPKNIGRTQDNQSSRRKHRRIAKSWLSARAVNDYSDVLDKEATVLLQALYDESQGGAVPVNPQVHLYLPSPDRVANESTISLMLVAALLITCSRSSSVSVLTVSTTR